MGLRGSADEGTFPSETPQVRRFAGAQTAQPSTRLDFVFDPTFLRKLDRLRVIVRWALSTRPGNTPMPRGAHGSGIELEGHKQYHPGDDLRHLDWNAYFRLDEMLIKTFRAEREAPLHVFLDTSASMVAPDTDDKLPFARQLAASLAYIALRRHDPVRIVALGDEFPASFRSSPVWRHRDALPALRTFLESLHAKGQTVLQNGAQAALQGQRIPGRAVLISDFLVAPAAYQALLADLSARHFTVIAVRVLGEGERDPSRLFRKARIVDAENGQQRHITLNAENLTRYEQALSQHLTTLRNFCTQHAISCVVADTAAGIERCIFHDLTAAGVVH